MKTFIALLCTQAVLFLSSFKTGTEKPGSTLYSSITTYLQNAEKDFDKISRERKTELKKVAHFLKTNLSSEKKASLIFICTHNSRRSHMGQIWAMAAAEYYGITGVAAYSGGLEITAFNPNAIKALTKAGFVITNKSQDKNPHYEVSYASDASPVVAFSKKYMDSPNPTSNFAAIMTCTHADETCPVVQGASVKISTPYEDPKKADGQPNQDQVYDERCKQIATEILYSFYLLKTMK